MAFHNHDSHKPLAGRWSRPSIAVSFAFALFLGACGGGGPDADSADGNGVAKYIAVVDAGSTGSRLYLYETAPAEEFGTITMLFNARHPALPSLAGFKDNPVDAGSQGIRPLLDDLTGYLSAHHISPNDVPVSVMGTAGMRMVDTAQATAIYSSVRAAIAAAGYAAVDVKTIQGKDEGLYSWADVNYAKGVFQNRARPYGLIEIGGASAQVAYVSSDRYDPNVASWIINGTSYPVLSTSYLGLGTDAARKTMIKSENPSGGVVQNACYTSGYQFGANVGDPAPAPGIASLSGSYDYVACTGLYEGVLNQLNVSAAAKAGGLSSSSFLVVGGFPDSATSNWGMPEQSLAVLENNVRTYCQANSWASFLERFGTYAPSKYQQSLCADSTYVNAFLFGKAGVSLRSDQTERFKSESPYMQTWTRGYALLSHYGVLQ